MSSADSTTAAAADFSTITQNLIIYAGADTFGRALKDSLLPRLQSLPNTTIVDLGVDKYYQIAAKIGSLVSSAAKTAPQNGGEVRGLLICGTGAGVAIFANKYPGVYAVTCRNVADATNARSINNSNVITLSGAETPVEEAVGIVDAWIRTPFKSPCPASMVKPWPEDILDFLEKAPKEMAAIPEKVIEEVQSGCAICCLRNGMEFEPVGIMPGGEMRIVRESPTSAYVRFKAGSVEPAHHHTFGHDLVVIKGKKKVWNLTKNESYGLVDGDFLFTPAGDVHRVKYFEDTEFFIKWDGHWDIFLDEDLDAAKAAVDKELDVAAK